MTIRILVADDHAHVRAGLCGLLDAEPDMHVVGTAENGQEAHTLAASLKPDVLLLDMHMPVADGVAVACLLRQHQPALQILGFSEHMQKKYVLGVLACGAAGYLTKEDPLECVVWAVRQAAGGQKAILSPRVVQHIRSASESVPTPASLTLPDAMLLRLMAAGYTDTEIASTVQASAPAVGARLHHLFDMLALGTRYDAIAWVWKTTLLVPERPHPAPGTCGAFNLLAGLMPALPGASQKPPPVRRKAHRLSA